MGIKRGQSGRYVVLRVHDPPGGQPTRMDTCICQTFHLCPSPRRHPQLGLHSRHARGTLTSTCWTTCTNLRINHAPHPDMHIHVLAFCVPIIHPVTSKTPLPGRQLLCHGHRFITRRSTDRTTSAIHSNSPEPQWSSDRVSP
jgi:hypothetical protein